MPRRAIELLDADSFIFADPSFHTLLPTPLFPYPRPRPSLATTQPWWRKLGLESGRSITDLPIRQTYYFATEGDQPGADPANRAVLAHGHL